MPTKNDYRALMKKARRTNRERDRIDRAAGFASPGQPRGFLDLPSEVAADLLRTAICAIASGISTGDWNCIAEAQVFLIDAHPRIDPRGLPYGEQFEE